MLRRFLSCQQGAAAAEMALLLPLMIVMLFTGLEAGHYMYQRHQVTKALRDGVRFAARQDFNDMSCSSGASTAVVDATRNVTRTGQVASGGVSRIPNWQATDITVLIDCTGVSSTVNQTGIYDSTRVGRKVVVQTDFNYTPLFGGLGIVNNSFPLDNMQQATVMGL